MSLVGRIISYGLRQGKVAAIEVARCRKLPSDIANGYRSARRLSRTQDFGIFRSAKTQGTSFIRQTNRHLPGILAGVATPFPITLSSPLAYALGKILQKFIKRI